MCHAFVVFEAMAVGKMWAIFFPSCFILEDEVQTMRKASLGFIKGVLIKDETYLLVGLVGQSLNILYISEAFFDFLL